MGLKRHYSLDGTNSRINPRPNWLSRNWHLCLLALLTFLLTGVGAVAAQEADLIQQIEQLHSVIGSLWLIIAGALVFFMNAGFSRVYFQGIYRTEQG
jgi:hypothetical protein